MVSSSAARKSLALSLVNVYETFAISWPTVVDAALKRVEKDVCDDRLFDAIGSNVRMITKKELFHVPVFGPALREAGFIEIDRSNRRRAVASLQRAKEMLSKGVHVWIPPEGTRSKTGELMPFKKEGFNLALDAHLPVLPVTVSGTRDVLRANVMNDVRKAVASAL